MKKADKQLLKQCKERMAREQATATALAELATVVEGAAALPQSRRYVLVREQRRAEERVPTFRNRYVAARRKVKALIKAMP